jgi:trehalose-6-phosphatase
MSTAHTSLADHAGSLAARADQVALCLDFDGTLSRSWPTRRRPGCCPAWASY